MAAAATLTTFDAMMKDYYTDERVENMIYADNPFLALIPKDEKFPGRKLPIPIVYGNPMGRSANFAQAVEQSALTTSKVEAFELTRVKDYGLVTIDSELIEASDGDDGSFLEAQTVEVDGIINALTRSLAISMFRKGWGKIGTIGSSTGSTITLSPISDAHNFEIGMIVVFSSSEDAATLRDSAEELTVSGVNRNTGVITFTSAVSGIASIADGDSIFVSGDRQDSATPTRLKVAGLEDWCPATAPSASENFFAVDRSVDSRLYGSSYNGASDDISDALITGASKAAALGYKLDHFFLSFDKYAELEKELQDGVRYVDLKGPGEIGFRGIALNGPRGPIKVLADQNCPSNRAFGVQMKYLKLRTMGKCIKALGGDGLQMLRMASADGVEIRYGYRGNMSCSAPGSLVNVQL